MTITEANEYMIKIYLEEGWLIPHQVKKINQDALVIMLGIISMILIPAVLILIIGLT